MLKDKKILVGVTGSIAIYKALELIRLFIKANAEVRVVMSESAKEFITPLTFETISQNEVLHVSTESWAGDQNHIHIGKWADIFVIAPATANTINKASTGIADNLLLQTLLAFNKPVLIAPSANTNMILHQSTQNSLKKLKEYGYEIIKPQSKLLACNDEGTGAMAEPSEIFYQASRALLRNDFWSQKRAVVSGGGTKEKIDDVRFITNRSSGKMALALAKALYLKGADVTYVSANEQQDIPSQIGYFYTPSSKELKERLESEIKGASHLFMASAVSDYVPLKSYEGKLKKESLGDSFSLELTQNIDILKSLDKCSLKSIGFKAETDEKSALDSAKNMLKKKNLDAVCLNIIKEENGFGSDKNEIIFVTKEGMKHFPLEDKLKISFKILEETQKL